MQTMLFEEAMENKNFEDACQDCLPDLTNLQELQYDFPGLDLDSDDLSPASSSGSSTECFTFLTEVKQEATDKRTSCKENKERRKGTKKVNSVEDYKIKKNLRERRRIKRIADGFMKLKNSIPHCRGIKRLSKINTLRNALSYIYHLSNILHEDDIRRNALQAEQMSQNRLLSINPGHILMQDPDVLYQNSRPIFMYPTVVIQPSSTQTCTNFMQSFPRM